MVVDWFEASSRSCRSAVSHPSLCGPKSQYPRKNFSPSSSLIFFTPAGSCHERRCWISRSRLICASCSGRYLAVRGRL